MFFIVLPHIPAGDSRHSIEKPLPLRKVGTPSAREAIKKAEEKAPTTSFREEDFNVPELSRGTPSGDQIKPFTAAIGASGEKDAPPQSA